MDPMHQNISFELYKVFYTVAKELSFSKAAENLFLSQSAVSQSIRQLEHKLDTPLFNRSTKQVSLTQAGLKLLEHIEPAVHMIRGGENYLLEMNSLERGQLHIGASDTICKHYLVKYLKAFHTLYPGIELKVTNRTSIKCVDLLNQGAVDLIVTNLPNTHLTEDMHVTETLSFKDVFIASNNRHLGEGPYTLERLSKEPILMLTKATTTSEYLYQLFSNEGLQVTPSVELGSIDLLVDLTAIDLGISFVPEFCLPSTDMSLDTYPPEPVPSISKDTDPSGPSSIHVLNITTTIPPRTLGIVTHTKRPLTEAASKFIELLIDE